MTKTNIANLYTVICPLRRFLSSLNKARQQQAPHLQRTKWLRKRVSFVPHRQPLKQVIHAVVWQPVSSNPHGTRRLVGICECEQLFAFKVSLFSPSASLSLSSSNRHVCICQCVTDHHTLALWNHMWAISSFTRKIRVCVRENFHLKRNWHSMTCLWEWGYHFETRKLKHCKEN